jgi:hypothetical protein
MSNAKLTEFHRRYFAAGVLESIVAVNVHRKSPSEVVEAGCSALMRSTRDDEDRSCSDALYAMGSPPFLLNLLKRFIWSEAPPSVKSRPKRLH